LWSATDHPIGKAGEALKRAGQESSGSIGCGEPLSLADRGWAREDEASL
jgi:hypothetical protein